LVESEKKTISSALKIVSRRTVRAAKPSADGGRVRLRCCFQAIQSAAGAKRLQGKSQTRCSDQ
jgi:hypothetical protein